MLRNAAEAKMWTMLPKPKGHCQIYYFSVANYEMIHTKFLHSMSFKLGDIDRLGGLAGKASMDSICVVNVKYLCFLGIIQSHGFCMPNTMQYNILQYVVGYVKKRKKELCFSFGLYWLFMWEKRKCLGVECACSGSQAMIWCRRKKREDISLASI